MNAQNHTRSSRALLRLAGSAAALALLVPAASAMKLSSGDVEVKFDSTLSFGGLYRLSDPSPDFYSSASAFNGVAGRLNSANTDDGNLNYGKGWASQLLKGNHDVEVRYGNFNALARGYWYQDFKADDTRRTPLSEQAKDRTIRGAQLLDLFGRMKLDVAGGMPLDLRFGRQVLSLGESTFIPNGINVVNSADLSKLRVPGSELKEALLPVNMIKASLGVTSNITVTLPAAAAVRFGWASAASPTSAARSAASPAPTIATPPTSTSTVSRLVSSPRASAARSSVSTSRATTAVRRSSAPAPRPRRSTPISPPPSRRRSSAAGFPPRRPARRPPRSSR